MISWYDVECDISVLKGKTLTKVDAGDDYVTFSTSDGETYIMAHQQDCCENVYIEDINGDLEDLVGAVIAEAEEVSDGEANVLYNDLSRNDEESYTWTFYKLRTIKGGVVIRWFGSSNGYYSESVSFVKKKEEEC